MLNNKPKNAWQLICQLMSGKIKPNPLWEKSGFRWKFLMRSVFVYPNNLFWLQHLAQYADLALFLQRQSNLPCKLLRPYLSVKFSTKQNVTNIKYHYDFISKYYKESILGELFSAGKPYILAQIIGKNDESFTIEWVSEDRFGREGEFCLYFIDDASQACLAVLTFSVIDYYSSPVLFIGGLQGSSGLENSSQLIQQATKSCYGLFPKRILMEAASYLAQVWGVEHMVAVSNQTHIYNNWRYQKRFKHVFADYDQFWQTLEGEQDQLGHFVFPIELARKPLEEVASKKRAEYRRRYDLLDRFKLQVLENSCFNEDL